MEFQTEKVNNFKVKPVVIVNESKKISKKKLALFGENNEYCNVAIIAKKNSGKTNAVFEILKLIARKNTVIIIFSSTVKQDRVMKTIIEHFEDKDIPVFAYSSIKEDDALSDFLEYYKYHDQDENDGLEFITVFDDLSQELQNPLIREFACKNRHYKSVSIYSTQYVNHLAYNTWPQMDICILFGGHPEEKIAEIHKKLDLSIDEQLFQKLYKEATKERYNFLFINSRIPEYRFNFDKKIIM